MSDKWRGGWYSTWEGKEDSIPEAIRGSDWYEAFAYAPEGIDREDVSEVIACYDGCSDEENWIGVFKLKNGSYLYLSAGCDYTGWDCQASGVSEIRESLDDLIVSCVGISDRQRLNLEPQRKAA